MRIVIGEDEALLRAGLTHVLERGGFDVVAAASDADELIAAVERHRPELLVTDIRMPPSHTDEGLRAALDIRRSQPALPVVVLSQHLQRRYAIELLAQPTAGVGYLLKQRVGDMHAFCDDLRRVHDGASVLDPQVVQLLLARARTDHDALRRLTTRQQEVLALMAEGRSNAAIGRALAVSERTVVLHTSHIYDELGLPPSDDDHRRVLAVVRFLSS